MAAVSSISRRICGPSHYEVFTAWNYGIRNSLRAHEITRILCKINGMEINYFARLGGTSDKCRVSSSRHRLKRVLQNAWQCNLSSSFPFLFNFRLLTAVLDDTVDVPPNFHQKWAEPRTRRFQSFYCKLNYLRVILFAVQIARGLLIFGNRITWAYFAPRASQTRFAFVKTSNYFVSRILPWINWYQRPIETERFKFNAHRSKFYQPPLEGQYVFCWAEYENESSSIEFSYRS